MNSNFIATRDSSSTSTRSIHIGDILAKDRSHVTIVVGDNNKIGLSADEIHGVIANLMSQPAIKRHRATSRPPRSPRGFVGREQELEFLQQAIRKKDAVLIHSPDGMGKTTLVKKAANTKAASNLSDGVIYLEAVDDDGKAFGYGDIVQILFDNLYESNPPYKVSPATARTHLSNTRPLVILDRFELPVSSMNHLPDLFPKGSVLVVNNKEESAAGEFVDAPLGPFDHADAIQFLALKSGLNSNDPLLKVIMDEICKEVHDFPLAIEVIANLIHNKQVAVEDVQRKLKNVRASSPDQAQNAIHWGYALAYSLLGKDQQDMLALAAAAPGRSVDRAWLESMAGGEPTLKSLESLDLLRANSPRMRLPEGMRPVIHANRSDLNSLQDSLLARLRSELKSRSLDFDFIRDELGNILGFIQRAFNSGKWQDVITLGKAIDPYLMVRGLWDAWEHLLTLILQAGENLQNVAVQAWVFHQLGTRAMGIGNFQQAHRFLVRALRIRESNGDIIGAEFTKHNLEVLSIFPTGNGRGQGGQISEWLRKYLGLIMAGGAGIALVGGLLYYLIAYLPTHPLRLTIQATPVFSLRSEEKSIDYSYIVTNKSDKPVEGPIIITGNFSDQVVCDPIEIIGNYDNLLNPDEELSCTSTHNITSDDIARGLINIRARAEAKSGLLSNTASVSTRLTQPNADVRLTVNATPEEYDREGQVIKFTYVITNAGNTLLQGNPQIIDQNATPNCSLTKQYEFRPQAEIICEAEHIVTLEDIDRGTITNSGYALVDGVKSNQFTTTVKARIIPDLLLEVSPVPPTYDTVGQVITFNYAVENRGNSTANSIMAFNSDNGSNPICDLVNPEGKPILPPKNKNHCTSTYTVTQQDIDNGSVKSQAQAISGNIKSNVVNLIVQASQNRQLSLGVSANQTTYSHAGEVVTYSYVVTNNGNTSLDPSQLRIKDNKILNGESFLCGTEKKPMPPQATVSCAANYPITLADLDAKVVVNQASAMISNPNSTITSPQASATVTLLCPPRPDTWDTYTVRTEKTLDEITSRYGKKVTEFQDANCMGSSTSLSPGQKIYVPYLVSINGYVFNDKDSDKTKDADEDYISNFSVTVSTTESGAAIASSTTNTQGEYKVTGLLPGEYWVLHARVSVTGGALSGNKNFGLVPVP